jgi:glycosyltransferase involved in cell wall biosynthesis
MKIGIDCRTILNPSKGEEAGVGHYTYYLVKKLLEIDKKNQYVLFFDNYFTSGDQFAQENVKVKALPFYEYKKYLPLAYSQMLISAFLTREKLDVFHAPANTYPLPYTQPTVVTVHDLAIYKYPKLFPKNLIGRQRFATSILVPRSLIKAKKIIAISKNTKSDIIEEFGIPEDKIKVIYQGINVDSSEPSAERMTRIRKHYGIVGKYILFVGTIEPRKNIISLVKAFRDLRLVNDSPLKEYQLILVGPRGWHDKPIYTAIADANASLMSHSVRRAGAERRSGHDARSSKKKEQEGERRQGGDRRENQPVKYIGYVSHQDKIELMCNAKCFVYPSIYEGFGLPVAEAMQLGVPVITSNTSSLPEIVGQDGGITIDPNKPTELMDALIHILTDQGLRESLIIRGKQYAQEFNWDECARETLAVYEEVAKSAS